MKLSSAAASKGNWELPADDFIPLESLLSPSAFLSHLGEWGLVPADNLLSCKKGFVRYSPGVSCMVCYHVRYTEKGEDENTQEALFYLHAFTEGDFDKAAQNTEARDWSKGAFFNSPLTVPELRTIIYEFPCDTRLRNLTLLTDKEALRKLVAASLGIDLTEDASVTSDRLRYKPENRLVARCDCLPQGDKEDAVNSVMLRFEAKPDIRQTFELVERMYSAFEGNGQIGVPRPLLNLTEQNIQAYEWVESLKLSELLRGPEAGKWVCTAAQTLALLHKYEDKALPDYEIKQSLKRAEKAGRILACAGDDIRSLSENILGQLHSLSESTPYGQSGFVHGDFHQGQVLCDGTRNLVIDFGRASNGETVADVGNFLAQLDFMELRQRISQEAALDLLFLDTYQRSSSSVVPKNRLKYWTALGLYELASRELRRLKPGWPVMAMKLLEKCRATLDR